MKECSDFVFVLVFNMNSTRVDKLILPLKSHFNAVPLQFTVFVVCFILINLLLFLAVG